MMQSVSDFRGRRPLILTVPGLGGSGPGHWQTLWERTRTDTARVDLSMWENPRRNAWVTKLDRAIHTANAPIILAAHSLGCLAVAWWAELAGQTYGWPVVGALLVAPPDVDRASACSAIRCFGPSPRTQMPFPSLLVASEDDPYASPQRSFDMARDWSSHFIAAGPLGHINAESDIGLWHEGQALLGRLIGAAEGPVAHGAGLAEVQAFLEEEPAQILRA